MLNLLLFKLLIFKETRLWKYNLLVIHILNVHTKTFKYQYYIVMYLLNLDVQISKTNENKIEQKLSYLSIKINNQIGNTLISYNIKIIQIFDYSFGANYWTVRV